jgi:lipoprotein-anchoring transpeptidase ErfK/SrfK
MRKTIRKATGASCFCATSTAPASRLKAILITGAVILAPALFATNASAQVLGYADPSVSHDWSDEGLPTPQAVTPDSNSADVMPARLRRAVVTFPTREAPGTIVIDTRNTQLYYVLGDNRAIRYGVGVGREGFTWSGVQTVARKAEWPDWTPPPEMIARQPYLPRFVAGGPGNPLGAAAMYLGASAYRIHGTNDPSTIGKFVSSGCIRLTNEDVKDLFSRVRIGAKVIVLPKSGPGIGSVQVDNNSLSPRKRAATTAPHRV